ncbi:hypothetical protein [Bradyrhizobium commune]|uniref:Polysaccharide biosynthesis protein C-terminal domain-containing protein n=1 Tax=Bradyrhizobium commune TaxID=83627 RepID=A0A7S9D337_9BRAD|nr:hypothetical protein [Bradyrhizobium commune]QPF90279.1 hypothetical protein IC761_27830 [Bradyrhizobium commune]
MIQKYILINMAGFAASSIIPVLLSPIYFRYFGPTDFGLIATVNGLLALTTMMDYGISSVLSQRLAGVGVKERLVIPARDLRLYVAIIAGLTAAIGGTMFFFLIVFKTSVHERINHNIVVIFAILALAMIERARMFAFATLRAGDRHALLNILYVSFSLLGTLVPFFMCMLFKGGFEIFLYTRCFVSMIEIVTSNSIAAKYISVGDNGDPSSAPGYRRKIVYQMLFSASSNILAFLLVWVDRIAVFWSSGVEFYGKYVVLNGAVMFAAGIIGAVGQSYFPTLVRAVKGIGEAPAAVWEGQMRVSLVLCAPACAFLFIDPVFVREFFFGRDAIVPPSFDVIVRCLSLYGYIGALVRVTNYFQLAAGRNEIAGVFNAVSAVLYFPAVFAVAYRYGAVGVAAGSLVYMSIYFLTFVYATGRIFPNFPAFAMFTRALLSFALSLGCLAALKLVTDPIAGALAAKIVLVGAMLVLTVSVLAVSDSITRKMIRQTLRSLYFKILST